MEATHYALENCGLMFQGAFVTYCSDFIGIILKHNYDYGCFYWSVSCMGRLVNHLVNETQGVEP
jgi:hypothetical protein